MSRLGVATSLVALMFAAPLAARAADADVAQGVTPYSAAFFADARPNTAYDMIQRLPGFTFDPGPQVRGFAGAAGNVIIDGERPTTKQDDLAQVLQRIPAGQVERVDLIRGGAPGIDMQGRTVMANVIRRKGGTRQLVTQLNWGYVLHNGMQLPQGRLEASGSRNGESYEAALFAGRFLDIAAGPGPRTRHDFSANPEPQCTPDCSAALGAKGSAWQGRATGAYERPFAGGRLRVNGLYQSNIYSDRESDAGEPASFSDKLRFTENTQKAELGSRYTADLGARTHVEVLAIQQLQRQIDHSIYTGPDVEAFRQDVDLGESIGRGVLRYAASPTLTFEGALEAAYNTERFQTRYTVNGRQVLDSVGRVGETRGEASGSLTWRPSPRSSVEAGVRVEASTIRSTGAASQQKSFVYPKPRILLTWSPWEGDQLRLRAERELGQLDFNSFVASGQLNAGGLHLGNVGLLPQDAWVQEAAIEHRFLKTGNLTLTYRRSQIANAVDRIPLCTDSLFPNGPCPNPNDPDPRAHETWFDAPGNVGRARESDLIADLTLPLDFVGISHGRLKATATRRWSAVTDPSTHAARPISQLHANDYEAHFSQDLVSLNSSWGIDLTGPFVETYYRFNELDQYRAGAMYGFYVQYKPEPNSSVRFEFNNATSRPFITRIEGFVGPRPSARAFDDYRRQFSGRELHIRLRHTFG